MNFKNVDSNFRDIKNDKITTFYVHYSSILDFFDGCVSVSLDGLVPVFTDRFFELSDDVLDLQKTVPVLSTIVAKNNNNSIYFCGDVSIEPSGELSFELEEHP